MKAYTPLKSKFKITIYLTDDGSTDGTMVKIKELFPHVIILKGTGNMYWAGGMFNSWSMALKKDFDAYLLLNDDTNVAKNIFNEMEKADRYSIDHYKTGGIYIGSTMDSLTKELSYGGAIINSKFYNENEKLEPNGEFQICDLGNANIMFVTKDVVKKIGILSNRYVHAVADYDYTLTAKKNHLPVLIMANYCGECKRDQPNKYGVFNKLTFHERVKYLFNPVGFAFPDQLKYMRKFYPYRLPFVYLSGWFKVFFPKLYINISKIR